MNIEMVNQIIDESGMKFVRAAEAMGVTTQHLYCLRTGRVKWTVNDIAAFCRAFKLTARQRTAIFLP